MFRVRLHYPGCVYSIPLKLIRPGEYVGGGVKLSTLDQTISGVSQDWDKLELLRGSALGMCEVVYLLE